MRFSVYGFEGSPSELKNLLAKGLKIDDVVLNAKGTGINVFYSEKTKGVHTGRPPRFSKQQFEEMFNEYMKDGTTFTSIAKEYGCSRTYASKVINRVAKEHGMDLEQERAKYYGVVKN